MVLEKLYRAWHTLKSIWSKAHSKFSFENKNINKKSYKLTLFLELVTQENNSNS